MTDTDKPLKVAVIGTGAAVMRALGGGENDVVIKDPISAEPVLKGERGRAWLADIAAGRRSLGVGDDDDATLAHWVIEAPWAHPAWHSYSLVLVHLRPFADGRKTMIYLNDATHELWLYAIDPNKDRNRIIESGLTKGEWLEPKNFAAQFIEISDELALGRVRDAAQQICDGKLSPDTDWMNVWAKLFGGNMLKDRLSTRLPVERNG